MKFKIIFLILIMMGISCLAKAQDFQFPVQLLDFNYQVKALSCQKILSTPFAFKNIFAQKISLQGQKWPSDMIKNRFDLLEFNALNLGVPTGGSPSKYDFKDYYKSEQHLKMLANLIQMHRPSMIILVEVFKQDNMLKFDNEFLKDQYEEVLIEGNDERGIDIGMWIRKDLPIEVEIHTHKNLIDSQSDIPIFSRDLPTYILREKKSDGTAPSEPFLIVQGTHYKSQRNDGDDTGGVKRRTNQALATSFIIKEYQKLYPNVPLALVGDFNHEVRGNPPDFQALRNIGMKDAFDVAPQSTKTSDRGTHFYFPRDASPSVSQLDTMMLNPIGVEKGILQSAQVLRHLGLDGNELPLPRTFKERQRLPSDHLPTLYQFQFPFQKF